VDPSDYCREVETYLCRKNEGHLVRIVGPAFEQVCGWASSGVPLKVVFRGIDQYCERYYAKGPRRRPIRIEFCEADVLDLFDAWRRAVGVSTTALAQPEQVEEPARRKPSLAQHIERAIARLATVRTRPGSSPALNAVIDEAIRELEAMDEGARHARGDARLRIVEALAVLDQRVMAGARSAINESAATSLRREADAELAPFGSRLSPDARARASASAFDRLIRETLAIPMIAFE
jgi:hypothetical protein